MTHYLHLGHPGEHVIPGLQAHVQAFIEQHLVPLMGDDWSVIATEYDARNHIDARAFLGSIASRTGPILLIRPIQNKALGEITQRLEGRRLVVPGDVYDLTTLVDAISALKAQYDLGEPLLPLHRVVALLVVRKLYKEHLWGGNDKGYMWSDWIPKGRGVDEEFQPHVGNAVFLLKQHGVLIGKISNGKKKLALNPDCRIEIGDILRNRKFSIELERVFARGGATLPARVLNCLDEFDEQ